MERECWKQEIPFDQMPRGDEGNEGSGFEWGTWGRIINIYHFSGFGYTMRVVIGSGNN